MSETTPAATEAAVAQARAKGAAKAASTTKKTTPKKGAPTAKQAAKKQPAAKAKAERAAAAREGSKKAIVLDMLRRPKGATLKEIMSVTSWQSHSVRGFISGAVGKKMGLKVESTRRADGERVYQIA